MTKLNSEQLKQIKEQLMKQIINFPESQREAMKSQIDAMNDLELEDFLIKNKLINLDETGKEISQNPFRLIAEGKLPSFKIAENDLALAVLELNPISKGHVLIIPKIPYKAKELKQEIINFSQLIGNYIKEKLSAKEIQVGISEILGEAIINVLPIYKNETLNDKKMKASDSELSELQKLLTLPKENKEQKEHVELNKNDKPVKEKKPRKKRKTPLKKLQKYPERQP